MVVGAVGAEVTRLGTEGGSWILCTVIIFLRENWLSAGPQNDKHTTCCLLCCPCVHQRVYDAVPALQDTFPELLESIAVRCG